MIKSKKPVFIGIVRQIALLFLVIIMPTDSLLSQHSTASVRIQADIQSSLIWRGIALERNPVIQAACMFRYEQFQAAFYGTQTFGGGFNATLLQVQYAIASDFGTFTPSITNYYFPGSRRPLFSFIGDGNGAHTLEASLSYTAPKALPLRLFAAFNFYNDPQFSSYTEAEYTFPIGSVEANIFAGVLLTPRSAWYSSPHSAIVQQGGVNALGFRVIYPIPITEKWSLPISAALIVNPNAGYIYAVIGLSIR